MKKTPSSNPLLIAGPCSAESEKQVLSTANAIAAHFPDAIYRAGIWKPRTRPNAFEGVGVAGLPWLNKVKETTGLRTATEVANAHHVEACLKAGIDVLWIGARTTVNPFSVQEIAEALRGCKIPVLVKNPVNAEFSLWLGALERLELMGIKDLYAIHRGFHTPGKQAFRNDPKWEMAIEFRIKRPDIPLICDPSHICGNPALIPYVSQKAIDIGVYGLMIETHIAPTTALSDAEQQLTPAALVQLMDGLKFRESEPATGLLKNELNELRSEINKRDEELLHVLHQRMHVVKEIGLYKKKNNLSILQVNRWEELLKARMSVAEAMGLDSRFVKELYDLIHKESIRRQGEVLKEESVQSPAEFFGDGIV
jgi:chorismate mutase